MNNYIEYYHVCMYDIIPPDCLVPGSSCSHDNNTASCDDRILLWVIKIILPGGELKPI